MNTNEIKPKIGIMTFYAAHNNGAALQAFALQQCLNRLGADAELIRYFDRHNEKVAEQHSRLYSIIHNPRILLNFLLHFRWRKRLRGLATLTDNAYLEFQKRRFKVSHEPYYTYDDLKEANYRYNAFVTGSDMVWTPIGQNIEAYFLQFADRGKRFSFSPSLTGTEKFSNEQHLQIQQYIKDMDILSCREDEGVKYVRRHTKRDCVHTLDPTLLFSKAEWCEELDIKIDKVANAYILVYMFDQLSNTHKRDIDKIAKERNLAIRYIPMQLDQQEAELKNGYRCGYGPREFVNLFMNASFILTNTYHGLMFSLLSENPFVLVHRKNNNKWKSNEGRMSYILNLIECENRYIAQGQNISDSAFEIDYDAINKIIGKERTKSIKYLQHIVESSKENIPSQASKCTHVGLLPKSKCSGCGMCSQICPFGAIRMEPDEEGFISPFVNLDACKKCGKCTNNCHNINDVEMNEPISAYGCVSKDPLLENSASGGAFLGFARYAIEQMHGYVFGAILDKDMNCVHAEASTMEGIKAFQKSKYIQSDMTQTYPRVKELLDAGKFVLFSGTPCQVAGLQSFIGKKDKNLVTISLICHGVPSIGFWKKYLKNSYPQTIESFSFRNRNNRKAGKTSHEIQVSTGHVSNVIPWSKDIFYKTFLRSLSFRESCYYCKYANPQRVGDITIGDFDSEREYPDFHPQESKSVLIINSDKGNNFFNLVENEYDLIEIDYYTEVMYNNQLRIPSVRPSQRDDFYRNLYKMHWEAFCKMY